MMKLTCRGLRSLTEAESGIGSGLTLVIGANGSGKSSAALAAGALLTRDGKLGRTKDDRARGLVADGARAAVVRLEGTQGYVEIGWPEGEVRQKGDAPTAGRIAAGLDRPAAVDSKVRAAMLIASLKAEPTKQEWVSACDLSDVREEFTSTAWDRIEREGWDAAVKSLADDGRAAKALWCRLTQSRAYQSTGATTWQPDGYETEDLATAVIGETEELVERTKHQRDMVLAAQAVGVAERERLANLARQSPTLEEVQRTQQAVLSAEDAVASWDHKLSLVDLLRTVCPCPHCDQPITIWPPEPGMAQLRKPVMAASVDALTLSEWRGKHGEAKRTLEDAKLHQQQMTSLQMAAHEAQEKLAGLPPLDAKAMERAELEWDQARGRSAAITATLAARHEHEKVQALATVIKLAGPAGLRQDKLSETIGLVNWGMSALCTLAGWPAVEIADDLEISYGGRFWIDLSESERWRVETVLAIEIARCDGSELVVLDRADVLDGRGRNGLLRIGTSAGVPILAFMTAPASQAQAIAATGCDVWIMEAGVVRQMEQAFR